MQFLRALRAAWQGISIAFKTEKNFRIHSFSAILVLIFGVWLNISSMEWLWILLSITLVMAAELLNTAIEAVTNLCSPAYHELAKKAKDTAAAAVLVIAIFALICGMIIFLPKLV
ncbi:hypothetical protein GCM10023231_32440 [Olivibacter ginsenosidimutans]|uniref:Diacylglycerol kinase family protein n=1 Tax=Olivibacter ginsenosidimutans TaxID=1176537 RepID=A0ABP9BWS4_9SPHI